MLAPGLLAAHVVAVVPAIDAVVAIFLVVGHSVTCLPEAGSTVAEVLVGRSWMVFLGKAKKAVALVESDSDMVEEQTGQYASNVVGIAVAGGMLVAAAAASSSARNCALSMAVDWWLDENTEPPQALSCLTEWLL